ncbi:MAG: penicillin-binding protein 2 [Cyanobacteria bacterium NC_groundwater_1444_Ag_S-0.65um_54_12]|nr:penicillin-binding protein 2 [Cyanobacteria bacterium NC_groundwater_1444_Ag_S-0.65um_54_12]
MSAARNPAREWVFASILVALILLLASRLVVLQVIDMERFRERAEGNRLRIIFNPAPRGVVKDRRGKILAASRLSYSITLYPSNLTSEQAEAVIDRLSRLLGLTPAEIRIKWQKAARYPTRILQDVDERTIAIVAENMPKLPGVSIDPITGRYYPRGRFASHLLGYTGEVTDAELELAAEQNFRPGDIVGKTGIEKVFDQELRGRPGRQQIEVDARGRAIRTLAAIPAVPGKDLTLALDANLQAVAERELAGKIGAIVCIDANSGEILALASQPDFDPNLFAGRLLKQHWRELNSPLHPLLNRAIASSYPPGSIFKIVTTVAAMEAGIVKENSRFISTGVFYLGNRTFRDWKPGGFGLVNFHRALVMSIDTVYYELGLRMGGNFMAKVARSMGLGQRTGILLPGETAGIIPDSEWKRLVMRDKWYPGDSVNMAIGQGYVNTSPLQLAVMTATVANGGRVVRPKLLRPPYLAESHDPPSKNNWKQETWQMLHSALKDVVEVGTGTAAKVPGVTAAGKTGSAQAGKVGKTHGWFVCYSPAERPRIAMAILLERAGHGGSVAAPIAGKLLRQFHGLPTEATKTVSVSLLPATKPATKSLLPASQSTVASEDNVHSWHRRDPDD